MKKIVNREHEGETRGLAATVFSQDEAVGGQRGRGTGVERDRLSFGGVQKKRDLPVRVSLRGGSERTEREKEGDFKRGFMGKLLAWSGKTRRSSPRVLHILEDEVRLTRGRAGGDA